MGFKATAEELQVTLVSQGRAEAGPALQRELWPPCSALYRPPAPQQEGDSSGPLGLPGAASCSSEGRQAGTRVPRASSPLSASRRHI